MTFNFLGCPQTKAWAERFSKELRRPCAVLLCGPMGSGKTQLVKWFAHALGANDAAVVSPTFAVHQEYATTQGTIDHVDLYRLTSAADLESSGFWDLFSNPQGLVFVEWADRLPANVWPRHWQIVFLQVQAMDGEQREIIVTKTP